MRFSTSIIKIEWFHRIIYVNLCIVDISTIVKPSAQFINDIIVHINESLVQFILNAIPNITEPINNATEISRRVHISKRQVRETIWPFKGQVAERLIRAEAGDDEEGRHVDEEGQDDEGWQGGPYGPGTV